MCQLSSAPLREDGDGPCKFWESSSTIVIYDVM